MPEKPPAENVLRPTIEDVLLQDQLRTREPREELITGSSGFDFDVHGLSMRVVSLPLFRRSDKGELLQALRVMARAASDLGNVTFSLSAGGRTLDRRTVRISRDRVSIDLFVPEVHETRSVTFEVANGVSEPFRASIAVHP
jgi:hypothetical protein